MGRKAIGPAFPFLLGGTFIEAPFPAFEVSDSYRISLPFGRDFH